MGVNGPTPTLPHPSSSVIACPIASLKTIVLRSYIVPNGSRNPYSKD